MKSENFVYWLQGFFEISKTQELDAEQVQIIKNHLNMVFVHEIDPSFPEEEQTALNNAHAGSNFQPHSHPLARC